MKYRKLPIEIEAIQWTGENYNDIMNFASVVYTEYCAGGNPHALGIRTLEGTMKANKGDYIIKGIKGEFYPCAKDIFEKTYEKVEEENEK